MRRSASSGSGKWGSIDARTVVATRTFQTFGVSESALDERVGGVIRPDEARISYRASFPKIAVKLMLRDLPDRAEARIEELAGRVRAELGTAIYGEGEVSMEEVVGRALTGRGATVALAESCSGGLIGHLAGAARKRVVHDQDRLHRMNALC